MKAYYINNEFKFVNTDYFDAQGSRIAHIVERDFTQDEIDFPKLNLAGNDIEVDITAKTAYQTKIDNDLRKSHFERNNLITKMQIEKGFIYNNITFSLSDAAQNNLNSLMLLKIINQLTFPHALSTKDDSLVSYMIADATEFTNICMAAAIAKQTAIDEGNSQKNIIKNLDTLGLQNYVNPRTI